MTRPPQISEADWKAIRARASKLRSHLRERDTRCELTQDDLLMILVEDSHNALGRTWQCNYCDRVLVLDKDLQVDHARPLGNQGESTTDNLCIACRECNIGKGKAMAHTWRRLLMFLDEQTDRVGAQDIRKRLCNPSQTQHAWRGAKAKAKRVVALKRNAKTKV